MLIFFDCGNNCPDARGFRCFFGKDIYNGISNRRYQEEALFGLCDGVVECSKPLLPKNCNVSEVFFMRYFAQFPSATCKAQI